MLVLFQEKKREREREREKIARGTVFTLNAVIIFRGDWGKWSLEKWFKRLRLMFSHGSQPN